MAVDVLPPDVEDEEPGVEANDSVAEVENEEEEKGVDDFRSGSCRTGVTSSVGPHSPTLEDDNDELEG